MQHIATAMAKTNSQAVMDELVRAMTALQGEPYVSTVTSTGETLGAERFRAATSTSSLGNQIADVEAGRIAMQ
jgi:hypothetical protein